MGSSRSKSLSIEFFLIAAFLLPTCFCSPNNSTPPHLTSITNRNALEIGIGIGIGGGHGSPPTSPPTPGCPPPPPPPCQPPLSPPPSIRPPPPPPPSPTPTTRPKPPHPPPVNPPHIPPPPRPRPPSPPASLFVNELQRRAYFVIKRFKISITSDPLNITGTWTGFRPCKYKGFFCETPPNRKNTPTIASVDFNGFRLGAPTLAGFIDCLPDLALFHANSNKLKGTVPNLTKLPFLYELDLSNNKLTGCFPTNVLPLNKLSFLDIRFNSFAGVVPARIFVLGGLDVLFLNNNNFSQPLPANLGSSRVAYLTLANNAFTGPIPRSIGNACNTLIEVLFLNNRLSGCLPYEAGLLVKSTVFDAGFNQITGPIPLSFGCLRRVEQLNLAGNQLYGEVPDVVCRLATVGHLKNLSLSNNYFTSVGESCRPLIQRRVLDLRRNCVPWLPNQRPADECAMFQRGCKVCPLLTYIPCRLPGGGKPTLTASLPAAEAEPAPSTVYSAMHKRHAF